MHVVGHPLNLLATNILLMALLPYLLGCPPEVVFLFSVLANLQGIVGHLIVDIRAGWLNYLLAGAEVHRWHHSARIAEAKVYGAVLMIFDLLFGTFVYRRGESPESLGVAEPDRYPRSDEIIRVFALSFVRGDAARAAGEPGPTCPDPGPSPTSRSSRSPARTSSD